MPYTRRTRGGRRPPARPRRPRVSKMATRPAANKTRRYRRRAPVSKSFGILYKPRMFTRFTYNTGAQLTTVSLAPTLTHIWRANSIYDPDYLNIGQNATVVGYTQAAAVYNLYRVYGAIFELTIINTATAGQPISLVLSFSNTNTFSSTITPGQMGNRPGSKTSLILPQQANGRHKYKFYVSNARTIGLSKEQYRTDPATYSAMGTNPTAASYFAITIGAAADPVNWPSVSVYYNLKITYLTELYDLIESAPTVN